MPFINNGEVALTTYNDVAGDQHIYNISTTSTVGPVALTALRFGRPSIAPFSKFIDLLLQAQTAFQDITPLFPHHQPIRKLGGELSSILSNTTLVGLLVESILKEEPWYSVSDLPFFGTITSRVGKYTDVIEKFVDDVQLFHSGLQFTLIGSLWRRVFWSIMWHLSEDSDVTRIVQQALQQLASFQRPLNLLIDTLGKNKVLRDYLVPAQLRDMLVEQLLANSGEVSQTRDVWVDIRPSTYKIDICLEYFSSFSDLQSLVNASSYIPLDNVDLVDVSNHRLITAETSESLAASTSGLEIQQIDKAFYISSKPMFDQCPRCDSMCNEPVNGWHVW
ncbi:hypothetical protein ONZ45_g11060 [Pleurotus djamor]|nr:hypothetical protein ONZ45_g11060 [Pleurotus djamor]